MILSVLLLNDGIAIYLYLQANDLLGCLYRKIISMANILRKAFFSASAIFLLATASEAQDQQLNEQLFKLNKFLFLLKSEYVDTINTPNLVEKAIVSTLKQLDPHSVYISKEEVKKMSEPLEGNFEGIGIEFNILDDTLIVVNPIQGGPSQKVGLIAGDRILKIDGKNVTNIGMKNSDVFTYLRGTKGTKVELQIKRRGDKDPLDFVIIRDKIPIYSVDAAYNITPKVGYIKISRFAQNTFEEFVKAYMKMAPTTESLVLDLRGNSGGYLGTAIALSDQFLDAGKKIVFTEGNSQPRRDFTATNDGIFQKGKLVVLVDEGSASASEIVAGAIQDWDRGLIIGRRTFGKGLVQNQQMLPDGSMVRLTVARYHTPTGRVIQRPFKNGDAEGYYMDLYTREKKGELTSKDSIHFADSLKYNTLMKKRIVYGGGGIMPDIFVPMDTTWYTKYYGNLSRKGVFQQFVVSYVDQNRKKLQTKFPNFEAYNKNFSVEDIKNEFVQYGKKMGVEPNDTEYNKSATEINAVIKGLIAQKLWDTTQYFQVINSSDETLKQALDALANWPKFGI